MKNIITKQKMDINTAVDYAVDQIRLGAVGFFVNTQFGYIPVEVFHRYPMMDSSSTTTWKLAQPTKWVTSNRLGDYKYHVSINCVSGQDSILTKMQLIREFSTVMYMELNNCKPSYEDISTLISAYIMSYEKYSNDMGKEKFITAYIKANTGINKFISSSRKLIENEVRRNMNATNYVIEMKTSQYTDKFKACGFTQDSFGNIFYTMMFTMCNNHKEGDRDRLMNLISGDGQVVAYDLIKNMITGDQ